VPRRVLPLILLAAIVPAASARAAVDARLEGSFRMAGRITIARDVRGEHAGQRVMRTWRVDSTCPLGVCRSVALRRGRARGADRLVLRRRSPGVYTARGSFTTPLRCAGRTYRRGGLVLFSVTLTITAARTVQTTPFATAISARYDNSRRVNRTPCPGGLGRDAARYGGARLGLLPAPPRPDFAIRVLDPVGRGAEFTASGPRSIVAFTWDFGDPGSGPADLATGVRVQHAFSGFGAFAVTLQALDGNGLIGTAVHPLAF